MQSECPCSRTVNNINIFNSTVLLKNIEVSSISKERSKDKKMSKD